MVICKTPTVRPEWTRTFQRSLGPVELEPLAAVRGASMVDESGGVQIGLLSGRLRDLANICSLDWRSASNAC